MRGLIRFMGFAKGCIPVGGRFVSSVEGEEADADRAAMSCV
ncbi:hypothetical protein PR003_g15749 [Phytophthora rubi]|uniref:Uncharacterized protein n=1 Tax=Phytophthora rubi TaxID=129364 RepID=A0A6A4EWR6_9STRA|nr:hypothetical protein PR003_g15749 [Phytophthora rubi]